LDVKTSVWELTETLEMGDKIHQVRETRRHVNTDVSK